MSNLFLKKARALFRAGFALIISAMLFAACDSGSSDGEEAGAANPLKAFSVHGITGNIDAVKKTVNVAVPYFAGIDVSALDVEVSAEEGAVVIPLSSGTADFSAPKTFTITAGGVSVEYTVTVYVLFDGEAGLAQLYDYADPDAKLYTEAKPLYAALSGLEFDAQESLNGRPFAYLAEHIAYYLRDQYAALDLSRCAGAFVTGYVNSPGNPHSHLAHVVSVIFPDTAEYIGERFFQSNTVLKEVTLPEGITAVGNYVFYGCTSLSSVNFPSSLKKIGGSAFWGASIAALELNEGLEEIGSWAFNNAGFVPSKPRITNVAKLPSTLKVLGDVAFYGNNFKEIDLSATQIAKIGLWTFLDCAALETVKFPSTITSIGIGAFKGAGALKTLDFSGTGIKYVGFSNFVETADTDFSGCTNLETLIYPETVVEIGARYVSGFNGGSTVETYSSFNGGGSLKGLVLKAASPPRLKIYGSDNQVYTGDNPFVFEGVASDFAVYVPDASVAAYQAAANWSAYAGAIKGLSQWTGK